ncbi:outer membrane receptor protein involved in Fe transport [Sphingomonas jinjuensis]|uniref:Outer membrane receptor protein involved in Fe transport n=1 Tax=Sphingomonas jinjuensis TaxID=535907 RepID=A0A840FDY5_9SPHN|nr:TonB-dependent receptor [Sphingomonas jinjuensis]MBB4152238.1 outer membrane receptor protein involved in Fe transport [Sphingomonas jinjuensis]
MMKGSTSRSAATALLRGLLLTGGSAGALLIGGAAQAQQTTPPPAEPVVATTPAETAASEDNAPGDIVVTGSRIRSSAVTSPSPLQAITSQDIASTGRVEIQDVLQLNPAFGLPGQSRNISNFGTASAGLATVNLRNLGANRTLVLIDGRRVVAGVPGTAQVDLTMIPSPFIERVDVLTGGASAVYGSDAIAGVVNFIYKKNFEGLEANVQAGVSEQGDDSQYTLNLTLGHNFGDGRGNIMLYGGYTNQGLVRSVDRARSVTDQTSIGALQRSNNRTDANLTAAQNLFLAQPNRSTVVPAGTFAAGTGTYIIDPTTGAVRPFVGATDGFDRTPYQAIAVPLERYMFAGRGNYEVGSNINVFMEGTYASVRSQTFMEPLPLVPTGNLGLFRQGNGRYNIEGLAVNPNNPAQTTRVVNPLVPTALYNLATDTNGDGFRDVSLTKRLVEFGGGQRFAPVERTNLRLVAGAEGKIGSRWNWEAYYSWGETKASQSLTGLVNQDRFVQALDVVRDVYDVNRNGSTTDAVCASAEARAQGCVPIDVYGLGKISPEAIAYVQATSLRNARQTMQVAAANISGAVFDLPAGPLQVAIGAEYRKESSREDFDPLSNVARNGYVQLTNTSGSFDVKEAYGELSVPILRDTPFFHSLELRAAGRVSDYSTVGTFYAWNLGAEWAPVADIRLRGVYARAVRAPNIGELYAAPTVGIGTVNDPCAGVTAISTGTTSDVCRAAPGVLANIQANGGIFTLNQTDRQGVGTLSSSNPNIREEKARTYTLGVVVNPVSIPALRNLALTIDYYNIRLDDAIARTNTDYILQRCYSQNDPLFCGLVSRRTVASGPYSAGSIQQINAALVNSGGAAIRGIDTTASYRQGLAGIGLGDANALFQVSYSHIIRQTSIPLTGAAVDRIDGEINSPRDRAQVSVGYDSDSFGFTVNGQYIGASYLDDQYRARFLLADGSLPDKKYFRVKPYFYTDLQMRFKVAERFEFYGGANNLFDVQPPRIITGLIGSVTGTETAAGTYDPIGRRYYAGARIRF